MAVLVSIICFPLFRGTNGVEVFIQKAKNTRKNPLNTERLVLQHVLLWFSFDGKGHLKQTKNLNSTIALGVRNTFPVQEYVFNIEYTGGHLRFSGALFL
jgi:hypothetical protein